MIVKTLIDKRVCEKGYAWKRSNCECECDKSCNIGEYLRCKCRKNLTDQLIDKCIETMEEKKIANITAKNENDYESAFCIVYIVLVIVAFTVFMAIIVCLIYYNCYLNNNNNNNNNNIINNDDDSNHNKIKI